MTRRGFTLIELVITLLVIGIISIVLVTDFISSYSAIKLEAARWKLKSDLLYAQSLAVTQQVRHGVVFYPAQDAYCVYRQGVGTIVKNPLTAANFTVSYATDPDLKGVNLVSTGFGLPTTDRVEFDPFGTPSDGTANLTSDGTVTLAYAGSSGTVTVNRNTGRIQ